MAASGVERLKLSKVARDDDEDGMKGGGAVKQHRARGGKIGMVGGDGVTMRPMRRMDRPGRKRGGAAGAEMKPLSMAAKVEDCAPDEYANGGWIAGAIKKPGALHRSLGVPEGTPIPASKLDKAAHSDNPTLRRRAILAETLKGFHKG